MGLKGSYLFSKYVPRVFLFAAPRLVENRIAAARPWQRKRSVRGDGRSPQFLIY